MTKEEIPLQTVEIGIPYILEIMIMKNLETCTDKRKEEVKKNSSHDIMISSVLL